MASVKLVYAGFSSPNCECAIMASKKKIRQKELHKACHARNEKRVQHASIRKQRTFGVRAK
jgi:hypothetical protein